MFLASVIAFLLGLLLGSALPYFPLFCLAVLSATAGILLILEWRRRLSARHASLLYAGLLLGVLYWTGSVRLHDASSSGLELGAGPRRIVATVDAPVRYGPGRAVLFLSISAQEGEAVLRPASGRLRLTWRDPGLDARQGDHVAFTAGLHAPSGLTNPGGFDYGDYLSRQGVDAVATISGPEAVVRLGVAEGLRWPAWRVVEAWRNQIRQAALTSLEPEAAGIYLGMIVGQAGYLSQEIRDQFMASGTVHILSISGSHIGLVAFLVFFVIKAACRRLPPRWLLELSRRLTPTRLAAAGTVLPVVAYTLLAGSEVATVRSLVMVLLFLLAVWLGREERLFLTLACAALLILLHDPDALFDVSFQLSYCSVLAIAWVIHLRKEAEGDAGLEVPAAAHPGHRLIAWLSTYAWITGGVTLATLPLVAHHFNQVSWVGLLANLFVIPLAGLFLVPLGLVSALLAVLTGSSSLPLARLNQMGLDGLLAVVQVMARLPGAEWHVASPSVPAVIAFYALLLAAVALRERRVIRMACLVGVSGLVLWWGWSPRALPGKEMVRVTVLDVGQGDAIVLELPDGKTVLIDGGTRQETFDMGRGVVAPYLWDRGIFRLDHVIATHPQLDHAGGLISIVRLFPVARYWDNGVSRQEHFYQDLRRTLRERSVPVTSALEGQTIHDAGDCRLLVLNPPPLTPDRVETAAGSGTTLNNRSIVTRLDCGPHSFLFTADVEMETLARLTLHPGTVKTRVLKVPHHGAKSSLHEAWLRRLGPDVAVISVGRRNPYGHPAPPVLEAYRDLGIALYRTDRDGAVWITASPTSPSMTIRRAGDARLRPVRFDRPWARQEQDNLLRLWEQWQE